MYIYTKQEDTPMTHQIFDNETGTFESGGLTVVLTDEGFVYTTPDGTGTVESISQLNALIARYA
jgi:hypothetical protein